MAKRPLKSRTIPGNMAATHPKLSREFDRAKNNGIFPQYVTASTSRRLAWKCSKRSCGHQWTTTGASRVKGAGCPGCSNKVATHLNNMTVTHTFIAATFSTRKNKNLTPESLLAGTRKKLWWVCPDTRCGYEWQAKGSSRIAGAGCPACDHKVVTTKNNMKVTHPELAREFHPTKNEKTARFFIAGTTQRLWWRCSNKKCRQEWQAVGSDRAKGRGCPGCADRSFKWGSPTNMYVLCGEKFGKVGVSNVKSWPRRLAEHQNAGFFGDPVKVIRFSTGKEAFVVEGAMKNLIYSNCWQQPPANIPGHSEAFPANKLEELINFLTLFEISTHGR